MNSSYRVYNETLLNVKNTYKKSRENQNLDLFLK